VLSGQRRQCLAQVLRGDHELRRRILGATQRYAKRYAFRTLQRCIQRSIDSAVPKQPHLYQIVAEFAHRQQTSVH